MMKKILQIILGIILVIINFAVAAYFIYGAMFAQMACTEAGESVCPKAALIGWLPIILAFLVLIFFLLGLGIKLFRYLFWILAITSPIGLAVAFWRGWFI
ncbi:MAG: hypothetical protein A2Z11_00205 [Candidatus Woykebacteria bacterium RBG_16_43_9]|uniref:Uncharacterized protein n=1 Tax=Candidatus Woykebacteria bacterium RBG_16_43_9 TaxID=1802596 RepID=A0A1G1WFV5_9BACT|nr:MAG: hypothetical protein A2Z11_00205 [Candidatus Woykebacteria bacterium RBG_16_43_9]